MKTWNDYKSTMRSEPDLFDYARVGDLRGLVTLLTQDSNLNLDAKNHRGYSALMLAVYNGERDFCEALLRAGADVNSMDLTGNTVLMASAFKGNVEIVKLLMQFGAATSYKNHANMNVRDWAMMFGRTDVVAFFDDSKLCLKSSSKARNIFRFIKLSFLLILTKWRVK
jgi:ankyrin repeat protein